MGGEVAGSDLLAQRLRAARARLAADPSSATITRHDGPPVASYEQERIWLVDRIFGESRDYNVPLCLAVEGDFDEKCFEAALTALVGRHEILRTVFPENGGQPGPVVGPPGSVPVAYADLRQLGPVTEPAVYARMVEHAAAAADRPFALATEPPLRAAVLRCGERHRLVLLTVHHIATDGPSMELLWRELADRYADAVRGRVSEAEPLPLQYADYAAWERGRTSRGLAYWTERLAGLPDDPLPTDLPRSPTGSRPAAEIAFTVPAEVAQRLRRITADLRATPFMALLAGFAALLGAAGGQSDVVIGTPVGGRDRDELDRTLGPFLNVLPMRVDLSGPVSFADLVRRARETAVGAYAHQDVPFARLVQELRPDRSLGRNPLFQVMFAHQRRGPGGTSLPGATVRPLTLPVTRAKFDLSLTLTEDPDRPELTGSMTFATDLFEPATVRRLVDRFGRLLRVASERPEVEFSQLPLSDPTELDTLLLDWGQGEPGEIGELLPHRFVAQAARTPDAVAVSCGDMVLTYAQLAERSARLARTLVSRGLSAQETVGVCLPRSPDLVVGLLAVLRAGGCYLPIDPDLTADRIEYLLADSRTRWVVADGAVPAAVEVINVDDESGPADGVDIDLEPDQLAYTIYTSGSTGRPKGVMVSHRALANFATDMVRRLSLDSSDVVTALTTVSFDIAVLELLVPLTAGAAVRIFDRAEATDGVRLAARLGGVTVVQATPSGWALLVAAGWRGGDVRAVCGGEAPPAGLLEQLRARVSQLWHVYGPTETTVWSTAQLVGEMLVGLGRPLANTSVYVLDARLAPVPIGVVGELFIGGAGLARGYVGRPGLTAERFRPDPFAVPGARMYATGDLVRYRAGGRLEFLGRRDHQVKIRGHRIELGEIEARLAEDVRVEQAVVVAAGEGTDRFLVGYLVGTEDLAGKTDEVAAQLRTVLPAYLVPQRLVVLERLPLNANGKVDRLALPAVGPGRTEAGHVGPATELERTVAAAWAEVFGVGQVSVLDDFFALGGHSLRATQLVALLRERLGVEVVVRLVFEAPTVRAFAAALGDRPAVRQLARPVERDGPAPLSYAQQRLWFLERLRPGRTDYHVPSAVLLRGPLDSAALLRAIELVVERHEVLRSVFAGGPDGLVQEVITLPAGWLTIGEAATLDPADAVRQAALPFDLGRGPLVRARLIRRSGDEHLMVVVMHHAVVDGWSLGVFWREVSAAYRAIAAGSQPRLPTLPVQYADFAGWERAQDAADHLAYWRTKLAGVLATEIQPDRARPAEFDQDGAVIAFEIPDQVRDRLAELGRDLGATAFVLLLTAFLATLGRLCGRSDVVVGSPIAGSARQQPELARLIGPFLNTVVLRADLPAGDSFAAAVAGVRETVLAATAHQDLPFDELVQVLDVDRDLGRHPLFQIMFAVDEDESAELDLPGITAAPVLLDQPAKVDLSLVLHMRDGAMAGSLIFATALYRPATARGITDLFVRLLTEATARPQAPLSSLHLLDTAAKARLAIQELSAAACVHELFEAQAAVRPDAVAVEQDGVAVTYGELDARADRLAGGLWEHGVRPGRFVGIALPRSADVVVAMLAVLKCGAAYVPVDPAQPEIRNGALFSQAGVSVVLAPDTGTAIPLAAGVQVLDVAARGERAAAFVEPADLAYVTFTSGSTGLPKAVPATHASVTRYLRHLADSHELGPSDTVLQLAAISFDAATRDIFGTLLAGARLVLLPRESAKEPRAILRDVRQRKVTALLATVPSLLTVLTTVSDEPATDTLRLILTSGEELTPEVARRALTLTARLVNLYGPTECTMTSTSHQVTREDLAAGRIPVGKPPAGTRAVVVGPDSEPLPTGAVGELLLGGPGVSGGYLGDSALTARCFLPDPYGQPGDRLYRTGDLARFDHRGLLFFHGRQDRQLKVRGVRVEPAEIELALLAEPGVREAAVVVSDPGRQLAAWVVADQSLDLRQLRAAIAGRLPDQLRPDRYLRCPELPRTPHGKLDRSALARRVPAPARTQDLLAPRDQTELRLLAVWERVLGISPLGVRQNFFEAGGHSLKAVELLEEVRRRTGVELPLHALFLRPTVEGLAAAVAEQQPTRLVVPLVDGVPDQPPLFLVHPQSGDVCCYTDLARELAGWRPVYGIEAVGYSTDEPPLAEIDAMAARYLQEVRAVAPHGPYLLAGWSFGGAVALEMAVLLEAAGQDVAFLGLIDARAFGADELEEWYVRNTELVRFGIAHGLSDRELAGQRDEDVLAILTRHLGDTDRMTDYAGSAAVRRMIDVFTANGRAADAYRPGSVVRVPLHVFKATERHPTLSNPPVRPQSWLPRTTGGVHVVDLPGNHHDLASPPHVKVFAERLRYSLDQSVQAEGGQR